MLDLYVRGVMGQRVPKEAELIGVALKTIREAAGLSLSDIADDLAVSYQQVQKYEKGSNRFPVEKLYLLKRFYNIDYEDFFVGLALGRFALKESSEITRGRFYGQRLGALKDEKLRRQLEKLLDIFLV